MSDNDDEQRAMAGRYARRAHLPPDRYAPLEPAVNAMVLERRAALVRLLRRQGIRDLSPLKILEVGCGSGTNLLELLQLGASARHLTGNELLPERLQAARERLPQAVQLLPGDAAQLGLPDASFDIVLQSTVFSSILDAALQQALARRMWALVRPGGAVLWYDFTFDNPRNPDVRGVPVRRIRALFPDAAMTVHRVTLAPPLARRAAAIHPALYGVLNRLPLLRTHVLCWLERRC